MTRLRWKLAAAAGTIGMAIGFTTGLPLAGADTQDFNEPGSDVFTVPENVCSVSVEALGGQGGSAQGFGSVVTPGGPGGGQSGTFDVTPGEQLGVNVGGSGGAGTPNAGGDGGENGGGDGGDDGNGFGGGGGGGASDVRQAPGGSGCVPVCVAPTPPDHAGSDLDERVIVAGGGGGAGGQNSGSFGTGGAGGGVGGGSPDGNGGVGDVGAPDGGRAGADGGDGGADQSPGGDGEPGQGGDGGDATSSSSLSGGGGGGGGGDTGGGGGSGASGTSISGGGGGGGGSNSAAPNVTDADSAAGVNEGDGSVSITFTPETPEQCEQAGGQIIFVEVTSTAVAVVATARFTG